ncbi:MAG: NusG domain II-containing protein [Candidatus Latescibacteria bacterium]|nr:NusG domain II-containing protein [Candidatus Latescibacterota bacterium]
MRKLLTNSDKILIIALLFLAFASFWVIPGVGKQGRIVLVEQNSKLVKELPLDKETIVEVEGPLGTTVVKVESGKVRIVSSPCPRKLCVRMGSISKAGEIVVCVPNKVVVRIKGKKEIDAVTQ